MDVFVEHMIAKKNVTADHLKMAGLTFAALLLIVVIFCFGGYLKGFSFICLLVIAGIIYGWWYLLTSFKVEYEYILTNGEMDIDKIIAQRKRKRLITINFRNIEILAPVNGEHKNEFENQGLKTKIDASSYPGSPNAYFVIASNEKLGLTRVIFEPDDRIISGAKTFSPRKVFEQ